VKCLISAIGFALLFACPTFASERSALARVTVYWRGEGSGAHAAWNGGELHNGHCAVDPRKIPYGSKVVFPDATCVAVDSGPAVVNRKAARSCGRNAAERNAIVVDRFFDTKQEALAWTKAHPRFMMVRILTRGTKQGATKLAANPRSSPRNITSSTLITWRGRPSDFQQGLNLHRAAPTSPWPNLFLQYARRRT
jgi:3D (Asp-Asp-Asp) domain-containing protein